MGYQGDGERLIAKCLATRDGLLLTLRHEYGPCRYSQISLSAYYAHAYGKTVIAAIYRCNRDSNYGYFELNYKFQKHL